MIDRSHDAYVAVDDLGNYRVGLADPALRATGAVACWGSNILGALGQPTNIPRLMRPAAQVVGLANVDAIALGASAGWATTRDGKLYRWGRDGEAWATEEPVSAGVGHITRLAATKLGSVCALNDAGAVWCWTPASHVFARVHDGNVRTIAAEDGGLVALRADGAEVRTRLDDLGQNEPPSQPTPPPPGTTELASDERLPCALQKTGKISCNTPWTTVPGITSATEVCVDSIYGCALDAGRVTCFTFDLHGPGTKPELVPAMGAATRIAVTSNRVCAVVAGGRVRCHPFRGGKTVTDVIGSGAVDVALTQPSPYDFKSVTWADGNQKGGEYGCAVMRDRTVQCWGSNYFGELGAGSIKSSIAPLGVPGL